MLDFHPVGLEDREVVTGYMSRFGENSCQHSFATLYTLSEKYDSRICERDGFLYTLRAGLCDDKTRVYLAPMGGGDLEEAYRNILRDAAEHGCRAELRTVTRNHVDFLKKVFPGRFSFTELRDYAEYIYSSETLINMPGKRYMSKRNSIKNILRTYGDRLEVKTLLPEHIPDVRRLEHDWIIDNSADHDASALRLEENALNRQLDHFEELGISGIIVYIDGEPVAFYYGVAVNDECYDGLVEKARRDIPHLYKLVCWKVACMCASQYKYFNWEEDVGVPGLRNMKMQLGPEVLLRKYVAQEVTEPYDPGEQDKIPIVSDTALYPREELIKGSFDIQLNEQVQEVTDK